MRLSRDKVNKIAHVVSDALAEMPQVDFVEDRNTIRLETRKILEELLMQEAKIDQMARAEDRKPEAYHPRRQPGVGHPLSQVLQRGSEEAGNLKQWLVVGGQCKRFGGGSWPPLIVEAYLPGSNAGINRTSSP